MAASRPTLAGPNRPRARTTTALSNRVARVVHSPKPDPLLSRRRALRAARRASVPLESRRTQPYFPDTASAQDGRQAKQVMAGTIHPQARGVVFVLDPMEAGRLARP